jgi:hypothetical protein
MDWQASIEDRGPAITFGGLTRQSSLTGPLAVSRNGSSRADPGAGAASRSGWRFSGRVEGRSRSGLTGRAVSSK